MWSDHSLLTVTLAWKKNILKQIIVDMFVYYFDELLHLEFLYKLKDMI